MSEKHSKHYYEEGRNTSTTWKDEVIEDKNKKWSGGDINPKMLLSKEELDYSKDKIPNYYIGKVYGYEARKGSFHKKMILTTQRI